MMVLVIGGSASGKSEFCENLAVRIGKKKLYVATMRPFGSEAEKRIKRHRELRRGKGFFSVDCYKNLIEIQSRKAYDTVMLECMSNLVANEMFEEHGDVSSIVHQVKILQKEFEHFFIVSNDVFSDGAPYSKETMEYIQNLGAINREIAALADVLIEVVAGIPLIHKGREFIEKYI